MIEWKLPDYYQTDIRLVGSLSESDTGGSMSTTIAAGSMEWMGNGFCGVDTTGRKDGF